MRGGEKTEVIKGEDGGEREREGERLRRREKIGRVVENLTLRQEL